MLEELFCFLLDVSSIEGTVVQKRIAEVTQSGLKGKPYYKLKNTEKNLNRSKHMYSEDQIESMREELSTFLNFYGYTSGAADSET